MAHITNNMINDPKNPYIAGPTVDNTPAFIGRENILGNVLNILCHEGQNAIVLHGQRRIGKTSLLHELKARLSTDIYYPIFFDLLDKPQQSLEKVLQDLADEISLVVQKTKTSLGAEPKIAFCQWLNNLLNELPSEKSLVLLFDEFDVLDDPSKERAGVEFFPYLRNELLTINRKRLNFVFVIGRKIKDMTDIAGSLFREIPTQPVSLLKYEETLELIRLSEQKKTLFWSEEALAKIWQQTSGHPYLTQALCRQIWEGTPHKTKGEKIIPEKVAPEEVDKVIPIVLENSEGTLEWLWDGLGPIEKVVTSVLANATGGTAITETQLEHILSESGVQMMIEELESAAELLLKGWELIAPTENNSGYRFRVELLRRWIQENKPLNEAQKELDRIDPIADNLYQASLGMYHKGQLVEALLTVRQAIDRNHTHVWANQLLADILFKQKQFNEAREQLEQLYKSKPNAARTRLIRVLLTLAKENEDEDEQLKLYERVLKFETEHSEAKEGLQTIWQQRGDHAYKKGDLDKALEAYRKADSDDKVAEIEEKIQTQGQLPEWREQALDALEKGDKQKAQKLLSQIIAIKPEYKDASRYLHLAVTSVDPIKLKKSNRNLIFALIAVVVIGSASWLFFDKLPQMQKYEELQTELQNVQAERQKTQNDNERLQALIQNVRAERQETHNDNERLQALIQNVRAELQETHNDNERLQALIQNVQAELQETHNDNERLQALIQNVQAELQETHNDNERLQALIQNVRAERQKTHNDNERLQALIQNVRAELQETHNDNERLQALIQNVRAELQETHNDNERLQALIQNVQAELQETHNDNERLQALIQNVQAELQETHNDNERLQALIQNVQAERQKTQNDNERFQALIKTLQTRSISDKFVSQLKSGTYIVSIATELCENEEIAQRKVEMFNVLYPKLGAEKFLTTKKKWVVQLGKFYSGSSANKLVNHAVNCLGFPNTRLDKPYPIDVERRVHKEEHKSGKCP